MLNKCSKNGPGQARPNADLRLGGGAPKWELGEPHRSQTRNEWGPGRAQLVRLGGTRRRPFVRPTATPTRQHTRSATTSARRAPNGKTPAAAPHNAAAMLTNQDLHTQSSIAHRTQFNWPGRRNTEAPGRPPRQAANDRLRCALNMVHGGVECEF